MACDLWREKIDAYADAELSAPEMRAMGDHLRTCISCTADVLDRVQWKRAIQATGKRFAPSAELRQRIQKQVAPKSGVGTAAQWLLKLVPAAAILVLAAVAFLFLYQPSALRQQQTMDELADLHVATLASSTPVDVVSTDRHTVKPWFEGKLPFTFNLPELAGTPYTLEGGRLSYLDQAPGAELIYRIGKHQMSVFIFQERAEPRFAPGDTHTRQQTFNVETWSQEGLRYFAIGDAEAGDMHKLCELLQKAAGS